MSKDTLAVVGTSRVHTLVQGDVVFIDGAALLVSNRPINLVGRWHIPVVTSTGERVNLPTYESTIMKLFRFDTPVVALNISYVKPEDEVVELSKKIKELSFKLFDLENDPRSTRAERQAVVDELDTLLCRRRELGL